MARRLLESQDLNGLLLIRDTLQLSAGVLIPHLLQLALSADLQVTPTNRFARGRCVAANNRCQLVH